jgi:hypothetical protein
MGVGRSCTVDVSVMRRLVLYLLDRCRLCAVLLLLLLLLLAGIVLGRTAILLFLHHHDYNAVIANYGFLYVEVV